MEFSELIKNYNKIREYMRSFYIYGFKSREQFINKSLRTYDNEKRRCESYLKNTMRWSYNNGNKATFISIDCEKVITNPLFASWKSKSFTNNDIILHFYLLDILKDKAMSLEELTEELSKKSGSIFDIQTIRLKCQEYNLLGLIDKNKSGKEYRYLKEKNKIELNNGLLDAIKFFQGDNIGIIGDYLLDYSDTKNDLFIYKHQYIVHTLDDDILINLLLAIHEEKQIIINTINNPKANKTIMVPLKIFCSYLSGRRYLGVYIPKSGKYTTYRLDMIQEITILQKYSNYENIQQKLTNSFDKIWNISLNGHLCNAYKFTLTLFIDEQKEDFIINRILREGRGGSLVRLSNNIYQYSKYLYDINEASPWIKTFIGRIIKFEGPKWVEHKFDNDLLLMAKLYDL